MPNNQNSVRSVCALCHGQQLHINLWAYPLWPAVVGSNFDFEQRESQGYKSRELETALVRRLLDAPIEKQGSNQRYSALFDLFRQDLDKGEALSADQAWQALHNGVVRLDILSHDTEQRRITGRTVSERLREIAEKSPRQDRSDNVGNVLLPDDEIAWNEFRGAYWAEMAIAEDEKLAMHLSTLRGLSTHLQMPFSEIAWAPGRMRPSTYSIDITLCSPAAQPTRRVRLVSSFRPTQCPILSPDTLAIGGKRFGRSILHCLGNVIRTLLPLLGVG